MVQPEGETVQSLVRSWAVARAMRRARRPESESCRDGKSARLGFFASEMTAVFAYQEIHSVSCMEGFPSLLEQLASDAD